MHAQGLDLLAVEAGHHARLVVHVMIDQRYLRRFGIIAEQLDVNIRQPRRRSVPHGTAHMGPEDGHPLHPFEREHAQCMQFLRLGVGAEEFDVLADLGLDLVVVRQRSARREAQVAQCPALCRAVLEPLLHDEAGCCGGDFALGRVHRGILPAVGAPHMNISTAHGTNAQPGRGPPAPLT